MLQYSTKSVHVLTSDSRIINEQVQILKNAIENILFHVNNKTGSTYDLEEQLWVMSNFFREQKFSTVILPVLEHIAKEHEKIWAEAKQWNTQMELSPKSFENMKTSTREIRDKYDVIVVPLQRERELALLSIYHITSQTLGEVFFTLSKNPQ